MGLEVIAYSSVKFKLVNDELYDPVEDCSIEYILEENEVQIYVHPYHYPIQTGTLENHSVYIYKECLRKRIGSYTSYGSWKEDLYTFKEKNQLPPSYFNLLLSFSDCEGTLCKDACSTLAQEFLDTRSLALEYSDEFFRDTFNKFLDAFLIASEDGFLTFV